MEDVVEDKAWVGVIKTRDLQKCHMEAYCRSFLKYVYIHIQNMLMGLNGDTLQQVCVSTSPDSMHYQIKSWVSGMLYHFGLVKSHSYPKTRKPIVIGLGYPTELDCKALLLKKLHRT